MEVTDKVWCNRKRIATSINVKVAGVWWFAVTVSLVFGEPSYLRYPRNR